MASSMIFVRSAMSAAFFHVADLKTLTCTFIAVVRVVSRNQVFLNETPESAVLSKTRIRLGTVSCGESILLAPSCITSARKPWQQSDVVSGALGICCGVSKSHESNACSLLLERSVMECPLLHSCDDCPRLLGTLANSHPRCLSATESHSDERSDVKSPALQRVRCHCL
ncbi:hypothetical protein B0O80DRAFT_232583 [Mortierella sp. GBAus27b]|nr:hypothetical protein B0O80DRAFT_232583 [Mortierella sp. GBAus27b]